MVSRIETRNSGFTLLELSLTMLIVMVLLGFALPRFPRLFESNLQLETQKLAHLFHTLRQEAILKGESYKIVIDTKQSAYTVYTAVNDRPERFTPHTQFGKSVLLPDPITFSAVTPMETQASGSQYAGRKITFDKIIGQQVEVIIDSSGFMDMFAVRLQDQKHQISLSVVDIMGKIKIGEEEPL